MTIEIDSDIDEAMLATAEEAIARWDARAEVRKARNSQALAARRPLEADTPSTAGGSREQSGREIPVSRRVDEGRQAIRHSKPWSSARRPSLPRRSISRSSRGVVVGARDLLLIEFRETWGRFVADVGESSGGSPAVASRPAAPAF